ncbi:hypothetical protein U0070_011489, partial [Myodes glareolus]
EQKTIQNSSPSSHTAKAKTKALKAKKAELKGIHSQKKDVHIFHFPVLQHHEALKKHKYLLSDPKRNKCDHYAIIKVFLNTVSAVKKIENNNILVFFVNVKVNKHQNKNSYKSQKIMFVEYEIENLAVSTI